MTKLHRFYLATAIGATVLQAHADEPFVWNSYEDWNTPSVVALYTGATKGFCSGVVVGANTVLTAAHCLDGQPKWIRFDPVPPQQGKNTIEWRAIESVDRAPGATAAPYIGNDLALLTFKGGLPAGIGIATIVDATMLGAGSTLKVMGYGVNAKTKFGRKSTGLVHLMSPECVLGPSAASGKPGSQFECAHGLELMAGDPAAEVDACGGDSGGPLLLAMPYGKANWGVIGIVSRSAAPATTVTCGPQATIYTLVFPFADWLTRHGVAHPRSKPAKKDGAPIVQM